MERQKRKRTIIQRESEIYCFTCGHFVQCLSSHFKTEIHETAYKKKKTEQLKAKIRVYFITLYLLFNADLKLFLFFKEKRTLLELDEGASMSMPNGDTVNDMVHDSISYTTKGALSCSIYSN